ncbi:MAG TPA: hypothetical protein VJ044_18280, partial [Candidatus Hodarchaeales archaeon]|nr:hypothetical protein [Candidatus Hodarchaeales archaeon]
RGNVGVLDSSEVGTFILAIGEIADQLVALFAANPQDPQMGVHGFRITNPDLVRFFDEVIITKLLKGATPLSRSQ